jgi:NhaP-type Na+/H+ or K+/H+ antiporter
MQHTVGLTIAIALAAGILTQAVAFRMRIPGIVLLLGVGFLLGPEFVGAVRPAMLGPALMTLVGFAVAVVLFEGGMNLNLARLRREQVLIRRLVTWGGLMTAVGGAIAGLAIMRWNLRTSVLFGTLVMVTGPTVITPLLRRINVAQSLRTVLEAEGVIIDAIGALVAVVTLEVVLNPSGRSLAVGVAVLSMRLGIGAAVGLAGGALTVLLLRADLLVPQRLGNVFALAMALAVFQTSNALISESGLVACITAGIVVGNVRTEALQELREFKEQLTTMFIGMLFVLLSANLRWADLQALGWPGLVTVGVLMAIVRPAVIAACARGTEYSVRERIFLAWLAPRGIVAAAVSAMFAQTLDNAGLPGGASLRAMVFLVIVTTVVVQGLPAGLVVRLLGLSQKAAASAIVVGANGLGRLLARQLRDLGVNAALIDADPDACRAAEQAGLRVVLGSALEERTLRRAGIDSARILMAVTKNEGVNLLCARKASEDFRIRRVHAATDKRGIGISEGAVEEAGARTLFGAARDLRNWIALAERGQVELQGWRPSKRRGLLDPRGDEGSINAIEPLILPLLVTRKNRTFPVDQRWTPRPGDRIWVAMDHARGSEAEAWLTSAGWQRVQSAEQEQGGAA